MKFIVGPPGNQAIVFPYNVAGVAVFGTTTTDRLAVETIERSSKRGLMEPHHGIPMEPRCRISR
jgi:hypothetical protein